MIEMIRKGRIGMKKMIGIIVELVICLVCSCAIAGNWSVPGPSNKQTTTGRSTNARVKTTIVVDSIATRSGPSQDHTGCATLQHMKGRRVTALSKAVDASGICWVEIEVEYYSGAPRRCWVGAERLDLNQRQLDALPYDYEFALGEGTINQNIVSRMGPGPAYVVNKDFSYTKGTRVAVIASDGDYYIVENMVIHPKTGEQLILRSWVPIYCITMK